jgi:HK97 gp10 family phage protein
MDMQITSKGWDQINARLSQLERKECRKIAGKSLRAGAKIVRKKARLLAPVDSGKLKKSIKSRAGKGKRQGKDTVSVIVGRTKKGSKEAYYVSMVEFGHDIKHGKRKNKEVSSDMADRVADKSKWTDKGLSSVPGQKFIERAYDATSRQVARKVEATFVDELEKTVKAMNGK